jgi:5-methylcytosine-specific restriction endonuclease McrA
MAHRNTILARKKRLELIEKLGGKCAICNEPDADKLEFDHLYGRPYNPNQLSLLARINRYMREAELGLLRLLCGDCNRAVRVRGENGAYVRTEHADQVQRTQEFEVEI